MAALVTLFWNICILRVGPESVPARVWFILVLLIADMAVALLYHHILQLQNPEAEGFTALQALGFGLVGIATMAVVTRSVLSFRGLDNRFLPTLTALIGTDLLISIVIVAASQVSNLIGLPAFIASTVLQVWGIVVWGFIYHRAFNTTLVIGILIAFGIGIVSYVVGLIAVGPFT
ncbi:MAG: hypothetical protein OXP28_13480 [Gammaproteobacteria bacterium]|nr:hypothetical protein [Gammaproteobacteria bacterium]MDE0226125.1 hypothetical protein [Gammaproteobacteria bacterium]MDE0453033.1 hypothetical protein [Gammaproteobacteria bacterium]